MKRFLTTTALALTLGTAGLAADQNMDWSAEFETTAGQFYATDLIGKRIHRADKDYETGDGIDSSTAKEWDDIGEINDLIITKDGEVDAVILGIGGFLGMGERDVAIQMESLRIVNDKGDSDDRFLVVNASKEQLKSVPEYDRDAAATERHDGDAMTEAAIGQDDEGMKEDGMEESVQKKITEEDEAAANATEAAANDSMSDDNAQADADAYTDADAPNTAMERPQVVREGYAEVELTEARNFTADDLTGAHVYGTNDEDLGEISELLVEKDELKRAVVDVGGFLGIGEKPVAVKFDKLQILQSNADDSLRIYMDATEESLEAQPEYDAG